MDTRRVFPNFNSGKKDLFNDSIAGIVLALMIIPQGMSYALLAGLPPIYGLYASTLPVFLASLAGSSRYMQTGPVAMVSFITLIALGSKRKQIHEKLFFGSVSEKILKITKNKYRPTIILKI